jgi:Fe-S cluster biogenesis protein NfuA
LKKSLIQSLLTDCPKPVLTGEERMKEEVKKVIDRIRPSLQSDGGDVELIDVGDDGVVTVRLVGACQGCPMAQMTLKNGIEKSLKQEVPAVKSVVSV